MIKSWSNLRRLPLFCLCLLLLLQSTVPASVAQAPVYRSVKTESMKIALTFDDGPHPHQTERILSILDEYDVRATFFMVGVNVRNYPDAAKAVAAAGHEIGNHTYSHRHLRNLSSQELAAELEECDTALFEICGCRPSLFRPPEGAINSSVEDCTAQGEYRVILWSLDTRDWERKSTEQIVRCVLSSVKAGDIILMHDYIGHHARTAEALSILLPELLERGFEPVTVSELLEG